MEAGTEPSAMDLEHLKLLSIFHYVVSGLAALFSCIPFIHLTIGLVLLFAPHSFGPSSQQPPAFIGLFFVAIALANSKRPLPSRKGGQLSSERMVRKCLETCGPRFPGLPLMKTNESRGFSASWRVEARAGDPG